MTMKRSSGAVRRVAAVAMAVMTLAGCVASPAQTGTAPAWPTRAPNGQTESQVRGLLDRVPLTFEENRGQEDGRVAFLARHGALTAYFTPDGATYRLVGRDPLD